MKRIKNKELLLPYDGITNRDGFATGPMSFHDIFICTGVFGFFLPLIHMSILLINPTAIFSQLLEVFKIILTA